MAVFTGGVEVVVGEVGAGAGGRGAVVVNGVVPVTVGVVVGGGSVGVAVSVGVVEVVGYPAGSGTPE